jgi:type VI secretion system secreted protein Hcp
VRRENKIYSSRKENKMESTKAKTKTVAVLVLCGILVYALIATGGSLEPIAPPGPTMHTLDEIYNLIGSQVQKPKAFDCYMEIHNIPGESTDYGHQNWIDLLACSHGVLYVPTQAHTGGPITHGQCRHNDFTVVKLLDRASPKLSLFCCQGTIIPTVTIELCRATEFKEVFMRYQFEGVQVTAVKQFTAGAMLTDKPLEEVSFNYTKITWTYIELDAAGKKKGQVEHYWDVPANQGG